MVVLPPKWLFFDMDGTLIDTLPPLFKAYSYVKRRLGQVPSRSEFAMLQGAAMREIAAVMVRDGDTSESIERELEKAHARFLPNSSMLFPGVEAFLAAAKSRGFSLWVVTSAMRETANRLLKNANIYDRFDGIITSDGLKAPKPDPEIYLKAMRLANAKIDKVTVFEDSPQGISAALAANLGVVAHTAEESILSRFRNAPNLIANFGDWENLSTWFFAKGGIGAD